VRCVRADVDEEGNRGVVWCGPHLHYGKHRRATMAADDRASGSFCEVEQTPEWLGEVTDEGRLLGGHCLTPTPAPHPHRPFDTRLARSLLMNWTGRSCGHPVARASWRNWCPPATIRWGEVRTTRALCAH